MSRVILPLQVEPLNTTVTLVAVGAVLVGTLQAAVIVGEYHRIRANFSESTQRMRSADASRKKIVQILRAGVSRGKKSGYFNGTVVVRYTLRELLEFLSLEFENHDF